VCSILDRSATSSYESRSAGWCALHWSERLLDELFSSLLKNHPHLDAERLGRTRTLMNEAIPDATVDGYEIRLSEVRLPDEGDRHVAAAAIHSGARQIVTFNLKDFPADSLRDFGVEAIHPDDFLLELLHLYPVGVCDVLAGQVADLRNPPMTREDLLDRFENLGLVRMVAKVRELTE
jgi:hypothetical protein